MATRFHQIFAHCNAPAVAMPEHRKAAAWHWPTVRGSLDLGVGALEARLYRPATPSSTTKSRTLAPIEDRARSRIDLVAAGTKVGC